MNKVSILASVTSLAVAGAVQMASAQIINEDFESYVNTAAMDVNWDATGTGIGELVTTNGNPGQSAWHLGPTSFGGYVNIWNGTPFSITPSDSAPIRLTVDIYDTAVGAGQRQTVGLRNGADPLMELGHNNGSTTMYAIRMLGGYGSPSWVYFPSVSRTTGWNRYQATLTGTNAVFTLDIGADGSIDSTLTYLGSPSANPFNDIRFGGPSDVSGNSDAWFDNIILEVIPEPSTVALGLMGGLGLLWVLRRRVA